MGSIAQTRVATRIPVKTKVDFLAGATEPKTHISQDEGARLQKRLAAGSDSKALALVAALGRQPKFCAVKSVLYVNSVVFRAFQSYPRAMVGYL